MAPKNQAFSLSVYKSRRASTPKVRTGCITCKERRVKCDEGKPSCKRCHQANRICQGYRSPHTNAQAPRALAPAPAADPPFPIESTLPVDHLGCSESSIKVHMQLDIDRGLMIYSYPLDPSSHLDNLKLDIPSEPQNTITLPSTLRTGILLPLDLSSHFSLDKLTESENENELMYTSVMHIISATNRLPSDIVQQFFCGVHRFIPGISRNRLQHGISSLSNTTPPLEFSMLLLSICLITFPQSTKDGLSMRLHQEFLYITTKSLLKRVKTTSTFQDHPTISLIQAGIIIAVYEYARGMPDEAFQSLAECAKMGYAANLSRWTNTHGKGPLWKEEANTWWAILIYERLSYCDVTPPKKALPFSATMPGADSILPVEPDQLDLIDPPNFNPATISSPILGGMGPQGWSAQGVWILDQIHQIMRIESKDFRLTKLVETHEKLYCFTMEIMRQVHVSHELFCGSVAIMIRGLFLLHEQILAEKPRLIESDDVWWQSRIEKSNATLETGTNMMIDIIDAESLQSSPETYPPSRLYRLRAALRYLESRPSQRQNISFQAAEQRLRVKLDILNRYWEIKPTNM